MELFESMQEDFNEKMKSADFQAARRVVAEMQIEIRNINLYRREKAGAIIDECKR